MSLKNTARKTSRGFGKHPLMWIRFKNLQAENSENRPPIYKNPFSLKFEIGSYS